MVGPPVVLEGGAEDEAGGSGVPSPFDGDVEGGVLGSDELGGVVGSELGGVDGPVVGVPGSGSPSWPPPPGPVLGPPPFPPPPG